MYCWTPSTVLFTLCLASGTSARFLGPLDPAPTDISSPESAVRVQWDNMTTTLRAHFKGTAVSDGLSVLDNCTFSVGLFSVHDPEASNIQYHHTSSDIQNSTLGVNKVDGNSIYRVASMTKLITVYSGLLLLNPSDWYKPLTDIFPEIDKLPEDDPIHHVQWETITPMSLALQISGIPRDARPFDVGEVSTSLYENNIDPTTIGLPALTLNSTGINVPCQSANCSAVQYLRGIQSPTFPVFQTPGYADTNFILLGRVISKLTGLPNNEQWFQKAVFGPLGMTASSSISPTVSPYPGYVVSGDPDAFSFQGGITSSSGGVFSTTNDVAKLGTSILNGTLLASNSTRQWMKLSAFTEHMEFSVGMAWEIYRYTDQSTGWVIDIYTKLGDSGVYANYLVLIPDYNFGLSILLANPAASHSEAIHLVADILSETLIPALRDQAAAETRKNYAGTYASTSSSSKNTSSSITLAYNTTLSPSFGLTLTSFINDGYDVLNNLLLPLLGNKQIVLQPSLIDPKTRQRGFVLTTVPVPTVYTGLFSKQFAVNAEWLVNNGDTYGGQAFKNFYFDIAADGSVLAAEPAVLRGKKFKKVA
ncbi:beta-lactamase/transpeptidase-like protein [Xylariaceae sp. FL0255]|nr:beta-lactamase/transpeptidase-like protein [Xylariaceae sp. FL0255]